MCLGMNDDKLDEYERCASTSNRNFEEDKEDWEELTWLVLQQQPAAAIYGHFVDVRDIV